jgi:hypothetical protein
MIEMEFRNVDFSIKNINILYKENKLGNEHITKFNKVIDWHNIHLMNNFQTFEICKIHMLYIHVQMYVAQLFQSVILNC